MNNPRHVEAYKLFEMQPDKLKSEFVIGCILQSQQQNRLEEIIRCTISEALKGVSPTVITRELPAPTRLQSDLPDALLHAMDGF